MSQDHHADNTHDRAEQQVAATTDSYGGPVSEDELAEVYLPEGQDRVGESPAPEGPASPAVEATQDEQEDPSEKATRLIVG